MIKICLNMIVKNEEKIILRLLHSVIGIIDSYCICDTGCTDNTISIMKQFFDEHDICGKFIYEKFQDFGYNRSFALKACHKMPNADYVLLLDADMTLVRNETFSIDKIKDFISRHDTIMLFQGDDNFYYKNMRIVRNNGMFSYTGVTHEYVDVKMENAIGGTFERADLFIHDIGDGGAKTDKFQRDLHLLLKGLTKEPDNVRYMFYIANTYKDLQDYDDAIEYYKRRISRGGWFEEIWYSYFNIGNCYTIKGEPEKAIYYWLEAMQIIPLRLENIYEIIHYYRVSGKNHLAYHFIKIAYDILKQHSNEKKTLDYLFLQKDVYEYKIDYEMTIVGYYVNENKFDLSKLSMNVLENRLPDETVLKNVLNNYKFYTPVLAEFAVDNNICEFLSKLSYYTTTDLDFVTSTPSLLFVEKTQTYYLNTRFVNYRIDDSGGYIQKDNIETRNELYAFNEKDDGFVINHHKLLDYNKTHDCRYVGVEDIRLFDNKGLLVYNGNRGLSQDKIAVEMGEMEVTNEYGKMVLSKLMEKDTNNMIEKNWVLFLDKTGNKKIIYNWNPLVIGEDRFNHFETTHTIQTPNFFRYLRGSTNGIMVEGELWFICHLVSYEDRRYYYHIFVVLDPVTFELRRYTKLFTFEKAKVEYTLGFVYNKETKDFIIGYSTYDCSTKYICIPKCKICLLFTGSL